MYMDVAAVPRCCAMLPGPRCLCGWWLAGCGEAAGCRPAAGRLTLKDARRRCIFGAPWCASKGKALHDFACMRGVAGGPRCRRLQLGVGHYRETVAAAAQSQTPAVSKECIVQVAG